MNGVKRIVELRGGIGTLSRLIKQKIYRSVMVFTRLLMTLMDANYRSTDLIGCMETGVFPHFPAVNLPKPLSPLDPRALPPAVLSLSKNFTLDPELLTLLSEIETHTTSSPATQDTPSLQYRLLSLYATRHYLHPLRNATVVSETACNRVQHTQSAIVQEVLFIGALLFLSLPQISSLAPFRPVDYSCLLNRLTFLTNLLFNTHETLGQHPEFLLWISFLGKIFSCTSISLSAHALSDSSPFLQQLRAVSATLEIASWENVEVALKTMWWAIEPRHEDLYQCLWEGIVIDQDGVYCELTQLKR